jgi:hypothetical protein
MGISRQLSVPRLENIILDDDKKNETAARGVVMDYDVNGRWLAIVKTPDGNNLLLTFDFKVDGGRVTGTGESPAGSVDIHDGTYADGVVKFKVTIDGQDYPHELTATADGKLVGSIDFGGGQVSYITAGRGAAPPWVPNWTIPGWVG